MSATRQALALEFDDIIFKLQRFGGITQYWQEVTAGIERHGGFQVSRCNAPAWQRVLRLHSKARVFHSSYFRVAKGPRVRNVVTVHDMAFELGMAGGGLRGKMTRIERRHAYFAADALICVSQSTRDDLLSLFPMLERRSTVHVIHHGPTLLPDANGAPLEQVLKPPRGPYVLFVGGRRHYKNFAAALAAFAATRLAAEGYHLVCTGEPLSDHEAAEVRRHGLDGKVLSLGSVDRASLVSLYRHAHCLLYPSLFEGFGMPVLEAMMLGCPVVAAACTSIPEIAGNAALLVDRGEPEGLARAVVALGEPRLRAAMIDAGRERATHFSWARSVAAHAGVYSSLE